MSIYGELAGKGASGILSGLEYLFYFVLGMVLLVSILPVVSYYWGYNRGVIVGRSQMLSEQYAEVCKAKGGVVQTGVCVVVTPVP